MATTARRTYDLVDRILDGHLAAWLLERDAEGLSSERVAKQLLIDHDVEVSRTTIVTWIRDLKTVAS